MNRFTKQSPFIMERSTMNFRISILTIFILLGVCWAAPEFEVGNPSQSFENGKRRMEELLLKSNLPSEGVCWKAALEDLQDKCKLMNEESQARLALRFASCFMEMLGLPPYMCERLTPLKECMKGMDNVGLSTFREYFLHTQDMCYYLRQEIWQQETHNAVNRLTETAEDVTIQMYEQKYIQEQIFTSQQESLKVQSNMKKDNEDLYNAVVKVRDVFDDFSESAKEHQHISTEIFEKLSRMQKLVSWIQGEMSLLDSIFFYFGAIVFGYFATATARTRAARFWLIVLFMMAIWSEKVLYGYLTQSDVGSDLTPEDIQSYIWMLRKLAAASGTFIVLVAGAIYRDIQTVNNNMLINMNFTLEKVVQFINDQAEKRGLTPLRDLTPALLSRALNGRKADDEESSNDDSFSNYSSDDSGDDLESELKVLNNEMENTENVEPNTLGFSNLSNQRFFGKEKDENEQVQSPVGVEGFRRYNLRARSSTPRENPIIHGESVTEFAKTIKRRKPEKSNTPRLNYFSSDDDEL